MSSYKQQFLPLAPGVVQSNFPRFHYRITPSLSGIIKRFMNGSERKREMSEREGIVCCTNNQFHGKRKLWGKRGC